MHERPGLGVEGPASRHFCEEIGIVVLLEELPEGNEAMVREPLHMFRNRLAERCMLVVSDESAVKLGQPLVEPGRDRRKVASNKLMRELMVDGWARVLVPGGGHDDVVGIPAGVKQSGNLREFSADSQVVGIEAFLVLENVNEVGLRRFEAEIGLVGRKHGSETLQASSQLQGTPFRGVRINREMRRLYVDPGILLRRKRRFRKGRGSRLC